VFIAWAQALSTHHSRTITAHKGKGAVKKMKRRKQSAASAVIEASLGIAAEIAEEKLTMQARAVERDVVRETLRAKNLANAQRVIQHQYEQLGLTEAFLNGWLYKYLAFLEVRRMSELSFATDGMAKREMTIHEALDLFSLTDPDATDRVNELWMRMTGTIRNFKQRIGADGKPIPIYHWINKTFAKDIKGVERSRQENKESKGYDDTDRGDYGGEGGDKPDPNYVRVGEETASATDGNWFEVEESNFGTYANEREMRYYMRLGWALEGKQGEPAFTRFIIAAMMRQMGGKPNGADMARRLNAGDYSLPDDIMPELRDAGCEPFPIEIDERKVQRLIQDFTEGLKRIREKHKRLKVEKTKSQLAKVGLPFRKNLDDPAAMAAGVEKLLGGGRR
jgi:hypothetical protein